jgi:hypothetical protein
MDDEDAGSGKQPKPLPWKFGEGVNLIVCVLRDHGPLTAKEIKHSLRQYGQPYVNITHINKTLRDDLKGEVAFDNGKWTLIGDPNFT